MKLSELLEQITPLPYEIDAMGVGCIWNIESKDGKTGVCLVQETPCGNVIERNQQRTLQTIYMKHAANILPELLKALEIADLGLNDLSYMAEAQIEVRAAIKRAEEIEIK